MCRLQAVYQGMHSTWLSTRTGAKSGHWISVQIAVFFLNFHHYYFKSLFFWLCWVFIAGPGFTELQQAGVTLHCGAWASHCGGFSCYGARALATWAWQLWFVGLVASGHVASSQTRDRTSVPCIGRQILNHWTTREVLTLFFILYDFSLTPFSLLYS